VRIKALAPESSSSLTLEPNSSRSSRLRELTGALASFTVAIPLSSTSVWTRLLAGEVVEREAEREGMVEEEGRWEIKEQVDVFETALIRDVGSILSDTNSLCDLCCKPVGA